MLRNQLEKENSQQLGACQKEAVWSRAVLSACFVKYEPTIWIVKHEIMCIFI